MVDKKKFEDNQLKNKLVFLLTILFQKGTDVVLGTWIHCDFCTNKGSILPK